MVYRPEAVMKSFRLLSGNERQSNDCELFLPQMSDWHPVKRYFVAPSQTSQGKHWGLQLFRMYEVMLRSTLFGIYGISWYFQQSFPRLVFLAIESAKITNKILYIYSS